MRRTKLQLFARWATAVVVVAACTHLALGERGVVFSNGQMYIGELKEHREAVEIITTQGVRLLIARSEIDHLFLGTWRESFNFRLANLHERDIDGRLALAEEALGLRDYEAAMDAVQQAIDIDRLHERANLLLDRTVGQMRLDLRSARLHNPPTHGTTPATQATTATTQPSTQPAEDAEKRVPLVTAEQINSIRIRELRPGDRVRVNFENDVRHRYLKEFAPRAISFTRFRQLPFDAQVLAIRDNAPQLLADVQVLSDPHSLEVFRQRVLPTILSGCATSGCHGGQVNTLPLLQRRSETNDYTNFNTLMSWQREMPELPPDRLFGVASTNLQLITRGDSERSLLVHFAVPGIVTQTPHPPVPGYKPPLTGMKDARAAAMINWINTGLAPIVPPASTTQPAQER